VLRKVPDFDFAVLDNDPNLYRRIAVQVFIELEVEVLDELGLILSAGGIRVALSPRALFSLSWYEKRVVARVQVADPLGSFSSPLPSELKPTIL